jgi:protein gp37
LPRIDRLRDSPASVRFLSVEPLLEDIGAINLSGIHWVIVGGESGVGARPMPREWVESIKDQCKAANVFFFFKQWGGVRKGKHGRTLNGRTYDEMPPQAVRPVPPLTVRQQLASSLAHVVQQWTASPLVQVKRQLVVA